MPSFLFSGKNEIGFSKEKKEKKGQTQKFSTRAYMGMCSESIWVLFYLHKYLHKYVSEILLLNYAKALEDCLYGAKFPDFSWYVQYTKLPKITKWPKNTKLH
jgi:hypothetical protein